MPPGRDGGDNRDHGLSPVTAAAVALVAAGAVFGTLFWLDGAHVMGGATLVATGTSAGAAIWHHRKPHARGAAILLLTGVYIAAIVISFVSGGLDSPVAAWLAVIPLLATVMLGRRAGRFGLLVALGGVALLATLARPAGALDPLGPTLTRVVSIFSPIWLAVVIYLVVATYERARRDAEQELLRRHAELERTTAELAELKGLLPICMYCRRPLHPEADVWQRLEHYVGRHTDIRVSHGLCGACEPAASDG